MTQNDKIMAAYFSDVLLSDKTPMAESKKAEAKANAKQKFWAEMERL
jgi:hypothetical protein